MRLREMMSTPVVTLDAGESAAIALRMMREDRIRHVVVTEKRHVVGVVSQYDLRDEDLEGRTIGELMATGVPTAAPDTTLREAANLLRGRTIGCIPVVEDGRPVGIVTISDVLEAIGRGAERPITRGRRKTIFRRGPRMKPVG